MQVEETREWPEQGQHTGKSRLATATQSDCPEGPSDKVGTLGLHPFLPNCWPGVWHIIKDIEGQPPWAGGSVRCASLWW